MAAYGKNGKNKGKHRKRISPKFKVKGNKLAKRAMKSVGAKLKKRVDRKVLGFQVDRNKHHDNELVTSPHERKRVDEKFVEQRAEQREQKRELAANPPATEPEPTPAEPPRAEEVTLHVAEDGSIDDLGYGIDPATGRAYQSHAQKEACERIDEDLGDL